MRRQGGREGKGEGRGRLVSCVIYGYCFGFEKRLNYDAMVEVVGENMRDYSIGKACYCIKLLIHAF